MVIEAKLPPPPQPQWGRVGKYGCPRPVSHVNNKILVSINDQQNNFSYEAAKYCCQNELVVLS